MKTLGIALLLFAAACATSEGGKPDLNQSLPRCEDVWVPGEILPEHYEGCLEADGDTIVAVVKDTSGLIWYADRLVARPGQHIKEAAQ